MMPVQISDRAVNILSGRSVRTHAIRIEFLRVPPTPLRVVRSYLGGAAQQQVAIGEIVRARKAQMLEVSGQRSRFPGLHVEFEHVAHEIAEIDEAFAALVPGGPEPALVNCRSTLGANYPP
jgi:hypothetical protein